MFALNVCPISEWKLADVQVSIYTEAYRSGYNGPDSKSKRLHGSTTVLSLLPTWLSRVQIADFASVLTASSNKFPGTDQKHVPKFHIRRSIEAVITASTRNQVR